MRRTAIRPVEVLSIAVVLAVLVAIAIPAFHAAREAARQSSCEINLKQLGIAMHNYHDSYKRFPFGAVGNSQFSPERRWSWYFALAPFLEAYPPMPIDLSQDSSDPENWPVEFEAIAKGGEPATFHLHLPSDVICPNGEGKIGPYNQPLATYVGMAGIGGDAALLPLEDKRIGIWGYERQISVEQITGGTSNTIMVVETAKDRGVWLRSGPATVRGLLDAEPHLGPSGQFGGFHPNATVATLADGGVKSLPDSTERQVLRRMVTFTAD